MAQFQWRWRARSTRCVQHRPTTPAAALLGQQHQSSVQIRAHASPVACVRATYFPPATGEEQFDARSLSRALGLLLCVCTLRRMNALCRVLAAAAVVPVAKSGCNCIAPHSSTSHIATSYLRRAPGGGQSRRVGGLVLRTECVKLSAQQRGQFRFAWRSRVLSSGWGGMRLIVISDCPLWMPF